MKSISIGSVTSWSPNTPILVRLVSRRTIHNAARKGAVQQFPIFGSHPSSKTDKQKHLHEFASTIRSLNQESPWSFPNASPPLKLPALSKWFTGPKSSKLNLQYFLSQFEPLDKGSAVDIEGYDKHGRWVGNYTVTWPEYVKYLAASSRAEAFASISRSVFVDECHSLYLAQHEPPEALIPDIPPPFHHFGYTVNTKQQDSLSRRHQRQPNVSNPTEDDNGTAIASYPIDIYSSSLWLSRASDQTNTALHRDPNDNFFVQLSGEKVIRCFHPLLGEALFRACARAGHVNAADPKGHIMLAGEDRSVIDELVWELSPPQGWNDEVLLEALQDQMLEVTVKKGDAVYIPRKWWHTVRSKYTTDAGEEGGGDVVASVNWWFR